MHGCFCLISFVVVYFAYPETAGVALEDMDRLFGDSDPGDLESTSLIPRHISELEVEPPKITKRDTTSNSSWFQVQPAPPVYQPVDVVPNDRDDERDG